MKILTSEQIAELVQKNAIIYRCATPDPGQALLFGGGATSGTVHTPEDSIYLHMGRCDIWRGGNTLGALCGLRLRSGQGWVSNSQSVRQTSDLYQSRILIQVDAVTVTIIALRDQDLVVVDIEDERTVPEEFRFTLENWHDDDSIGQEAGAVWTRHCNRESVFEAYNRKVGLSPDQVPGEDPLRGRAWGLYVQAEDESSRVVGRGIIVPPGARHRFLIATDCQTPSPQAEETVAARCLARLRVTRADVKAMETAHRVYWEQFWARSYVELRSADGDAEYEERLWFATIHSIAAGSGGPLPLRFNGGAYLLQKDNRSWDHEYVFQNMRLVYLPLFAAGHFAFALDYFRLYASTRDFVRAQTRSLFHLDAVCYREGFTLWGCDIAVDVQAEDESKRSNPYIFHYFSNNLELCLLMEWFYAFSGDETFLRETLYPHLKDAIELYRQWARKGLDGRYHLAPLNALETWWNMQDPAPDLCGLHYLLPRAVQWGRQCNESEEILDQWNSFLAQLADIPVGEWTVRKTYHTGIHGEDFLEKSVLRPDGVFLPAAGPTGTESKRTNMENPELYGIFPWGLVGLDSNSTELRRAENTWNHRTWKHLNNGWAQDVIQLARLGWAEEATEALLKHASIHQRFSNGCFISPAAQLPPLLTDTPYFDASGVHAGSLNEMLLQSYNGILKIVPAVSSKWSGRFRLHASGGFQVEARFEQGQPVEALLTATRSGLLRVKNYHREPMAADSMMFETGEMFSRQMSAGESVLLSWREAKLGGPSVAAPEVIFPGSKTAPPRTAVLRPGGHWHDESSQHGQVGLEEDGLYPASRWAQTKAGA